MRNGIVSAVSLGKIKAAKLVVENSGVVNGQRHFACGECLSEGEGRLFSLGVEHDAGSLLPARRRCSDVFVSDLGGVQGNGVYRFRGNDLDRLDAGKRSGLQVGRKGDCIMLGANSRRQALRQQIAARHEQKTREKGNQEACFGFLLTTDPETKIHLILLN